MRVAADAATIHAPCVCHWWVRSEKGEIELDNASKGLAIASKRLTAPVFKDYSMCYNPRVKHSGYIVMALSKKIGVMDATISLVDRCTRHFTNYEEP